VNAAILTGWEQVYPLQIYAIDDTDKLTDVTKDTKCHSVEVDVLKVFYHYDNLISCNLLSL
jgi:hypothetical protein